ncbi:MAG: PilZ domain-containing protein [Deltaproteobacteria bacterium]|nr:PilZ domain-containing protein [Deltaproteobacteria bacterium]
MIKSTPAIGNRREYSRVDAYIPFEFRLVPQEECSVVRSRISGEVMLADFNVMPPLDHHPQMEHLMVLNKKLDTIIKMLALQHEGFHSLPFKFVSISGSGMKFSSRQYLSSGDVIEIKMILTMYQPVAIYIYGKVIRVERQTEGYFITTHFTMIDDSIQNHIVRFVFEMEREMLRERRNTE